MHLLLFILICFACWYLAHQWLSVRESPAPLPEPAPARLLGEDPDIKITDTRRGKDSCYISYSIGKKYLKLTTAEERVAGLQFHQNEAMNFISVRSHELTLVREPDNPKDRNAIKVLGNGRHVGYVAAETAARLAGMMDKGVEITPLITGMRFYNGAAGREFHITYQALSCWAGKPEKQKA